MYLNLSILTLTAVQQPKRTMIRNQKQLIEYENGDRVLWTGRADIHYHATKIVRLVDLHFAKEKEIEQLRINPHNDLLLAEIMKRK